MHQFKCGYGTGNKQIYYNITGNKQIYCYIAQLSRIYEGNYEWKGQGMVAKKKMVQRSMPK